MSLTRQHQCACAIFLLRALGADDVKSTPHACGVDDIAGGISCPRASAFFVWVTFGEQKWVTFRERRGSTPGRDPGAGTRPSIFHAKPVFAEKGLGLAPKFPNGFIRPADRNTLLTNYHC